MVLQLQLQRTRSGSCCLLLAGCLLAATITHTSCVNHLTPHTHVIYTPNTSQQYQKSVLFRNQIPFLSFLPHILGVKKTQKHISTTDYRFYQHYLNLPFPPPRPPATNEKSATNRNPSISRKMNQYLVLFCFSFVRGRGGWLARCDGGGGGCCLLLAAACCCCRCCLLLLLLLLLLPPPPLPPPHL